MSGPWEDFDGEGPWVDYQNGTQTKSEQAIGWLPAIANTITQGFTAGYADEISAAMDAAVRAPFSDQSYDELYDENYAIEQDRLQRSREQWPKLSFGSEMAGGVIGAAKIAKAAKAIPGVNQALSRLPSAVKLSGAGATGGAVYGSGAAQPGERLHGAAVGGGVGAVAAPAVGLGIHAGGVILKKLGAPVVRALQNAPQAQAERIVREAMKRGDIDEAFIREQMAALGPDATIADVADSMQRLARGVASMSGRGSTIARETLETRGLQQNQALLGGQGVEPFKDWFSKFSRSRITAADELYKEAREGAIDLSKPSIKALMARPSIQNALRSAEDVIKEQGGRGGNIELVDAVKQQLDDSIGEALRNGRNKEARRLINTKNAFLKEIDAQNPAYKAARNKFAGEAAIRDSLEQGEGIWRGRTDVNLMNDLIAGYTESEKAAFRAGALRGLIDIVESTPDHLNAAAKITKSPKMRAILKMVFPNDKAFDDFIAQTTRVSRFKDTQNRVLGNSTTAEKLSDQGMVQEMAGVTAAMRQGNDPIAMGISLLRELGFGNVSDETLEATARILFTRGADLPANTINRVSPRVRPPMFSPFERQAGIAGGTNALIQPQLVEGP